MPIDFLVPNKTRSFFPRSRELVQAEPGSELCRDHGCFGRHNAEAQSMARTVLCTLGIEGVRKIRKPAISISRAKIEKFLLFHIPSPARY